MSVFKGKERWAMVVAVLLAVLIGGCATSIKYSFDTKTRFAEQKSYAWATSSSLNQAEHLIETNVQVLADQLLAQKGFNKVSENADLVIKIGYGSYVYGYQSTYQLQELNLNIYKTENMELVWRGTALGTIDTDAASDDLKQAVQGILANFPPKQK